MKFFTIKKDYHLNKPFAFKFDIDVMDAEVGSYEYNGKTHQKYMVAGSYIGSDIYKSAPNKNGETFDITTGHNIEQFNMTDALYKKLAGFKKNEIAKITMVKKEGEKNGKTFTYTPYEVEKVVNIDEKDNGTGTHKGQDTPPSYYRNRTTNDSIESQVATKICAELLIAETITMEQLVETHKNMVSVIREEYRAGEVEEETEEDESANESNDDDLPF